MKIFYSARANAFYRDDFHGTRLISIPDPDWKPPMIKVPDPAWSTPVVKGPMPGWIRPLVEAPNPEWKEGAVDVPATVLVPDVNAVAPTVDIPDLEAVHPLIDTPDPSAVALLIEVPNPNCLLPPEDELVDVSEDDHRAIEATIATSLSVLTSDEQGRPITIPAPGQTAEQMLAGALSQRDRLITLATTRIAPLQDAVDLGDATEGDVANLKKWKQYRVAVNRVPDQSGFPGDIVWPLEPS